MTKILLAPFLVLFFLLLSFVFSFVVGVLVMFLVPPIAIGALAISITCGLLFSSVAAAFIALGVCLVICGLLMLIAAGGANASLEEDEENDRYVLRISAGE